MKRASKIFINDDITFKFLILQHTHLKQIIHREQKGYAQNRFIGFNVRQIPDTCSIDYAENFNINGAILSRILFIDYSKAFDLVYGT